MMKAGSVGLSAALAAAVWIGCQSVPRPPDGVPDVEPYQDLGQNLLRNASFENRLVNWRVPLGASWLKSGGIDESGALVIQAARPPDDEFIHRTKVEQCVTLGAGSKYELAAHFKADIAPVKSYANRAEVVWYESPDCSRGGQWGAFIEPKSFSGWQSLSRTNLTPALNARSAKITIYQNGRYSGGGIAYWDDVRFWPTEILERSEAATIVADRSVFTIAVGENYVSNGAFARDLDDWSISSKTEWSASEGRATPGSAKVTLESEAGGRGSGAFDQCFNFGEHARFEMGASVKRDERSTQNGGGRLRVTWYQNEDCSGPYRTDGRSVDPKDIEGWQDLRVGELTPLPNARSAKIQAIQSIRGPGIFSMYWDDLYFKPTE